jgi:hypothetical protein
VVLTPVIHCILLAIEMPVDFSWILAQYQAVVMGFAVALAVAVEPPCDDLGA